MAKQVRKKKYQQGKNRQDADSRESAGRNPRQHSNDDDRRMTNRDRDFKGSSSEKMSSLNDLSWYNKNPNLTIAAASLPFPYRPGMTIPRLGRTVTVSSGNPAVVTDYTSSSIPGVLQIQWIPSVGQSIANTDPASLVAKELYAKIRSAFSGQLSVDPPDLLIYLVCLDSIFSYIGSLKRIYRILTTYSPENYAVPDQVLMACGIPAANIPTWKENRMQLYGYINELIGMTSKFVCPAIMDYFNRHYWMNDNVYTDAPMANSQMFVFYQHSYFQFSLYTDPVTSIASGSAELVQWNANVSPTSAYNFGVDMIRVLAASEDAYTISGYFARAYEATPKFIVEPMGLDEKFEPVYVEEVLSQIENAKVALGWNKVTAANRNCSVRQNPANNAILSPMKWTLVASSSDKSVTINDIAPFLSIRSQTPTAADVVIASRLASYVDFYYASSTDTTVTYNCTARCGSELVVDMNLISVLPAGTVGMQSIASLQSGTMDMFWICLYMQFDWAPLLTYLTSSGVTAVFGDIHNLTTFSEDQLAQINRVCLFSEFNAFSEQ